MNYKNKLRVTKPLATIISLVSIIILSVVFQGCEKEEIQFNDPLKLKLQSIAEQYTLNIEFANNFNYEAIDLVEFENTCALLKTERDNICGVYEIQEQVEGDLKLTVFTKKVTGAIGISRLKSVSEGSGTVSTTYGLGKFYVGLEYGMDQSGNFTAVNKVTSWISGLDPYESYEQKLSSATFTPSQINFSVTGIRKKTVGGQVTITYTLRGTGYYGAGTNLTVGSI